MHRINQKNIKLIFMVENLLKKNKKTALNQGCYDNINSYKEKNGLLD